MQPQRHCRCRNLHLVILRHRHLHLVILRHLHLVILHHLHLLISVEERVEQWVGGMVGQLLHLGCRSRCLLVEEKVVELVVELGEELGEVVRVAA